MNEKAKSEIFHSLHDEHTMKAIFAAGCFWHVQKVFDFVPGVVSTFVGYIDGIGTPDYYTAEEKGFTEAIEIVFDSGKISYLDLLDIFWKEHDPTSKYKQRNDVGTRYRAGIYYLNEKQKKIALDSLKKIQNNYSKPIVTEIKPAGDFYKAEDYHQKHY